MNLGDGRVNRSLPVVTLYGRAGCHLCSDARRLLDALAARLVFAIEEVDIDIDAALLASYDVQVPVIVLRGEPIARAPLIADDVEHRLRAALATRGSTPGEP